MYASVLLDGADSNLGGQDIVGVPHDEMRSGMRVRAVWKPKEQAQRGGRLEPRLGRRRARSIEAFEPTRRARHGPRASSRSTSSDGPPPTSPSSGTRRRRRVRRAPTSEVQLLVPDRHRGVASAPASIGATSGSRARGAATTSPAVRSRSSPTSKPPARGRRSRSRTSRWTARGRCTKRGCACSTATSTPRSCSAPASRRRRSPTRCGPSSSIRTTSRRSGVDPVSLAGLQARALLDPGKATERDFAEVVARSRRNAMDNPNAQVKGEQTVEELLAEPYVARAVARRTTSRRSPTARSRSCSPAATGPASCASGPRGSAASTTASRCTSRACAISPRRPRPTLAARKAGLRRRPARRGGAVGDVQPAGADPARRARARRPTRTSTRRVARSPPTR